MYTQNTGLSRSSKQAGNSLEGKGARVLFLLQPCSLLLAPLLVGWPGKNGKWRRNRNITFLCADVLVMSHPLFQKWLSHSDFQPTFYKHFLDSLVEELAHKDKTVLTSFSTCLSIVVLRVRNCPQLPTCGQHSGLVTILKCKRGGIMEQWGKSSSVSWRRELRIFLLNDRSKVILAKDKNSPIVNLHNILS